jgi:hypothetical protein
MRTTVNLDDDLVEIVKQYAQSRAVGLGKAVSELVRRGATVPCPTRQVNGLQVFDLPDDSPRVTSKQVADLEANQE